MQQETLIILLTVIFSFLAVNFSLQIASIYAILLLLGYMILDTDSNISIRWKSGNNLIVLIEGIGIYVVFILMSSVILGLFKLPNSVSSIFSTLQSTTPIFATSPFMNFLAFGIFIAATETIVIFGRLYEWVADKLKTSVHQFGYKMVIAMLIIVIFFVTLHFTAKGITNVSALTLVGIMALFSMVSISLFDDLRPAIYFHILANSLAMLMSLGII